MYAVVRSPGIYLVPGWLVPFFVSDHDHHPAHDHVIVIGGPLVARYYFFQIWKGERIIEVCGSSYRARCQCNPSPLLTRAAGASIVMGGTSSKQIKKWCDTGDMARLASCGLNDFDNSKDPVDAANGGSALHYSVRTSACHPDVVMCLLANDVDQCTTNNAGHLPITLAAHAPHDEVANTKFGYLLDDANEIHVRFVLGQFHVGQSVLSALL
jgi:hypothetical protein